MKALYHITFLISILIIGCDSQVFLNSDLEKRELKGNVRFLKTEHFDVIKIDSVASNSSYKPIVLILKEANQYLSG